jgi:hypothetical protein
MIFLRARISVTSFDFQSSNFTFFWLAGRMITEGENPYNEVQYLAGHETYGIKWQPNKIFPFPLPLAVICIPFGLLQLPAAYITWQVITLLTVAMTIFVFLAQFQTLPQRRLLIPVFCRNVFLWPSLSDLAHRVNRRTCTAVNCRGNSIVLKKTSPYRQEYCFR